MLARLIMATAFQNQAEVFPKGLKRTPHVRVLGSTMRPLEMNGDLPLYATARTARQQRRKWPWAGATMSPRTVVVQSLCDAWYGKNIVVVKIKGTGVGR